MPPYGESTVIGGYFKRELPVFATVYSSFSKAVDLKSIEAQASRGSNPLPSAIFVNERGYQDWSANFGNLFFVVF